MFAYHLKNLVNNFLGNTWAKNYIEIVQKLLDGLVWFVGFYGISTFVGYLTPNPFLYK